MFTHAKEKSKCQTQPAGSASQHYIYFLIYIYSSSFAITCIWARTSSSLSSHREKMIYMHPYMHFPYFLIIIKYIILLHVYIIMCICDVRAANLFQDHQVFLKCF